MASRNFVQNNTPLPPGQFRRPSGGGGRGPGGLSTGGTPNTALNLTTAAPGMAPRTSRSVPQANVGQPGNDGSAFLAQASVLGRQDTGAGGMSQRALNNMGRFMPGAATPAQLQHATPSFNSHDSGNSEQGVPAFAGFGAKVAPFTRGIGPTSKGLGGMMWNGFDARPSQLDSTPSMGGSRGNGDPRTPNSLFADGTQTQASPFMMDAFTRARQAPESKHTGEGDIVNVTIPYAHVLRPASKNPALQPREYRGQVMLTYRGVEAMAVATAPSYHDTVNAKTDALRAAGLVGAGLRAIAQRDSQRARHTEITLTLFNFVQASTEDSPAASTGRLPDGYDEELSLLRMLDMWSVAGVAINDYGGRKRTRNGVAARANEHGYERAVNICVAGETSVLNLWGEKAGDSESRLYLILKRVPRADLAKLVGSRFNMYDTSVSVPPAGEATYQVTDESGLQSVDGKNLHPAPYQLVPYTHRGSAPIPADVLEYTTELPGDTGTYRGAAILVGHSHYPLDTLRPQYTTNTTLSTVGGSLTRTLMPATKLIPNDTGDAIESAKRRYRKLQALQNLSIANNGQALINAGQLRMFVNVHTEVEL